MKVTVKGFNEGLICRDMAYKLFVWNEAGSGNMHQGMHSCGFALDVLGYYPVWSQNEYWLCLVDGILDEDDSDTRIAASRLKPVKKLTREEFMAQAGRYLTENPHRLTDPAFARGHGNVRKKDSVNMFLVVVGTDPTVVSDVEGATCLLIRTDEELTEVKGFTVLTIDGRKYLPRKTYRIGG